MTCGGGADYLRWVYWLWHRLALWSKPTNDSHFSTKSFRSIKHKLHKELVVLFTLGNERLRNFW